MTILNKLDLQQQFPEIETLDTSTVSDLKQLNNGATIQSIVCEEGNQYSTFIEINKTTLLTRVEGDCSCSTGFNCQHVAVTLLKLLEKSAPGPPIDKPLISNGSTSSSLQKWLSQLSQGNRSLDNNTNSAKRVLYLLNQDQQDSLIISIQVVTATLQSNNQYSHINPFQFTGNYSFHDYLTELDLAIIEKLSIYCRDSNTTLLNQAEHVQILKHILQSSRCFWKSAQTKPLKPGPTIKGGFIWRNENNGDQQLQIQTESAFDWIIPTSPPYYIQLNNRICGQIKLPYSDQMNNTLLYCPLICPEEVLFLNQQLSNLKQISIPSANNRKVETITEVSVSPYLHIKNITIQRLKDWWSNAETSIQPGFELSFRYNQVNIYPSDNSLTVRYLNNEILYEVNRDSDKEQQILRDVQSLQYISTMRKRYPDANLKDYQYTFANDLAWINFLERRVPQLKDQGWKITIANDFSIQIVNQQVWFVDVNNNSDDWFSLQLGIMIGEHKIDLIPLLTNQLPHLLPNGNLESLNNFDPETLIPVYLEDKRILPIKVEQLKHIFTNLIELLDKDKTQATQLQRNQILQIQALEKLSETPMQWRGDKELQNLAQRLRNFESIESKSLPHALQATLRDYQKNGFDWLQFLREFDLAGILADDMGLGKTIQTLSHILLEKQQGRLQKPALIIAPTSVLPNWRIEAGKFTPDLSCLILHGSLRHQHFSYITNYNLIITSYALISRDLEILSAINFHLIVLDEAQIIKNPKAQISMAVKTLQSQHRLCLSGTPIENHLGELWSLYDFLMPGYLGDEKRFNKNFRYPIEKHHDNERRLILQKRISPFLLRRTKDMVAKELPEKTEIIQMLELSGEQRDLYETIRATMQRKVQELFQSQGLAGSHIAVLDALLKLRQVCCAPQLLAIDSAQHIEESAKLNWLAETLPELIEEGRKILLFSQFTSALTIIETLLDKLHIDYSKLTGQTQNREKVIDNFQNGRIPLFLISLKAGGTGLNLTAADTVIHFDPWWNPAVEKQATDRAYRIGQDKPVFVYKLVTQGTVEEKIIQLQAKKQAMADNLYNNSEELAKVLNQQDLEILFQAMK